jgi:hypothetical protein
MVADGAAVISLSLQAWMIKMKAKSATAKRFVIMVSDGKKSIGVYVYF